MLPHSPTPCDGIQLSNNIISAVQLDDESVDTIRELSSLCRDFRQGTTSVARIQRGSPRAGTLRIPVVNFRSKFSSLADRCQQIFTKDSQVPGMKILQNRLSELIKVLNEPFSEAGNDTGYSECVNVLEKLNYVNGNLHGVVEVIIEHHEHWKCTLAGQHRQPPLVRRLNFDDTCSISSTTVVNSPSGQNQAVNQQIKMIGKSIKLSNTMANSHGNPNITSSVTQPSQQSINEPRDLLRNAATANTSLSHAGGLFLSHPQPTKPTTVSGQLAFQGGLSLGGGLQLGSGLKFEHGRQLGHSFQLGQQSITGGGLFHQPPVLRGSTHGQQNNGIFGSGQPVLGQGSGLGLLTTAVSTITTSSQGTTNVSPFTFSQQMGWNGNTTSYNTQAPQRVQDRQDILYIPRQPRCRHEKRLEKHSTDTLTSQESAPDSITSKFTVKIVQCQVCLSSLI